MQGNPLFRVLALTAILAVLGFIVSAVARSPRPAARSGPTGSRAPAPASEDSRPAVLSIQLSAPATSLSLTSVDGGNQHIAPHRPVDLAAEFRTRLPIRGDSVTALLSIEWETPSSNHFVRLVLEPEGLDTRELILHAPADLKSHAITFQWPNREADGQESGEADH